MERRKPLAHKPKGSGIGPYKIFVTMLYGQHKWIERDGSSVRLPISKAATYMRTRANRIIGYLMLLEDWGLVESVKINEFWATIQLRTPLGMSWTPVNVLEVHGYREYELILPGEDEPDEL